jgi:hypothetical protein
MAFFIKCSFVKYLMRISLSTSVEFAKDIEWELLPVFGRTSTIDEENKKNPWIVLNFMGENWDFAFTISSEDR